LRLAGSGHCDPGPARPRVQGGPLCLRKNRGQDHPRGVRRRKSSSISQSVRLFGGGLESRSCSNFRSRVAISKGDWGVPGASDDRLLPWRRMMAASSLPQVSSASLRLPYATSRPGSPAAPDTILSAFFSWTSPPNPSIRRWLILWVQGQYTNSPIPPGLKKGGWSLALKHRLCPGMPHLLSAPERLGAELVGADLRTGCWTSTVQRPRSLFTGRMPSFA
jgi:hypothetical protein